MSIRDSASTVVFADIEDLYPLTPLQSGMLYHALRADDPGAYTEQFVFECTPDSSAAGLHVDALAAAWRTVVQRHAALRTGFVWEEVDTPAQVVLSGCELPVEQRDSGAATPEEREAAVEEFLAADRARGLDLTRPPLLRVTVLHASDRSFLVWTVHHLVIDGWSMAKVLGELGELYRGGEPPREARPFRAFVDWLDRQRTDDAARYWKQQLGDLAPPDRLELRPGAVEERRGQAEAGIATHELGMEVSAAVRASARAARVSLSTVFQAAWAVVLSHSGPNPQSFGMTVALRPADLPGAGDVVGPCINTVVQQWDPRRDESVRAWLGQIQRAQIAGLPHQHLGLPEVNRACGVPTDRPAFDTILAFENYPREDALLDLGPGLRTSLWKYVEDTAYPVTLVVMPGADTIRLQLFYDAGRFSADAVRTVLGRVEAALVAMAQDLDQSISQARLASMRPSIVRGPSTGKAAEMGLTSLHRGVERQAARIPHAPAIDDHGHVCTYEELDAAANHLAGELCRRGVGRGSVVALALHRTFRALVGILGVLKAGAAYVALDPAHPDTRLAYIVDDSAASVLLTEEATADRIPEVRILRLRTDRPYTADPLACGVDTDADDLCYVTYTSGSTGQPKGVAMQHRVVTNMLAWELEHGSVAPPARTLGQVSFTFDVSVQELFTTWCSGGILVLADEDERVDFESLVVLMGSRQVQRCYLSPTALRHVAETAAGTGTHLPQLCEVMVAGEPLEVGEAVRRLLAGAARGVRLENQYGSSECQVVSSLRLNGDPELFPPRPGIGSPIDDVDLYVLDGDWNPVPIGVPGTVCVGGAAVPRGYLGKPGETAARLVPDPFPARAGKRMYVTGDLGILHTDGELECLGRTDEQVKIRGNRVEPAEVRRALCGLAGIRDAVVVTRDMAGEKRLIAYVVADAVAAGTWAQHERRLRAAVQESLPVAFVPWRIVRIDAIPVTTSGKVDKLSLPDAEPAAQPPVSAPLSSPALAVMTCLWEEVLPADGPVAPDADFLALGGDSLQAIRLVSRVRKAFGVRVALRRLLVGGTPEALLAAVDGELGGRTESDRVAATSRHASDSNEEGRHDLPLH